METLKAILTWLDGKKSTIMAIGSVLISYAVAANMIDANLGAMLQTIISILTGGAVVATKTLGVGKK
jgi:hypothetical protein